MNLWAWLSVACGGAIGASLRVTIYRIAARFAHQRDWMEFPHGTIAVNMVGSFALGVLSAWLHVVSPATPTFKLLIGTGLCGSLTTFSTFALDAQKLSSNRRWAAWAVHVTGNVTGSFAAAWLGWSLVI